MTLNVMNGATDIRQPIYFEDFELDLDRRLLLRGGEELQLRRQSFEVLRYLVGRGGQLVTKEELLSEVWAGRAVTDDSITQCLMEIRAALGDKDHNKVKTLPRRGYIFDLPVSDTEPGSTSATARSFFISSRKSVAALVAIGLVLALILSYMNWRPDLAPPIGELSIAVLPFTNMSSDPEQEYFSDGITEEILNLLVQIPELKVTSRTSVFSFKGQIPDIPTVAKKLGVVHILEGSVRKADGRVRITAQLVEAENDVHLWSATYERKLDDIFAIQDEIAGEVVRALQIELLGENPLAVSTNIEAYNLYLKGKHFFMQRTKNSMESAETAYREAIALDASFALPWEGLARVFFYRYYGGITDTQEAMEASRGAAMRALELDDTLAEAWLALAIIQFNYDWDWSRAEVTTRNALKYGSKNARVLREATWIVLAFGEAERALELAQLAVELDPLEYEGLINLATTYWALERPKDEERIYRQILELYSQDQHLIVKSWLAAALTLQGRPEEGLQYLDFDSELRWQKAMSAIVLHSLGRHEEEQQLRQYMIDNNPLSWAFNIAQTYAYHGDPDKAFEWLDIAYEQRSGFMPQLIFNRWLINLHDDPRWEKILDKMELLEYWEKSQAKRGDAE